MTQNDSIKKYKCINCNYETIRHYNLIRHQNAKHKYIYNENNNKKTSGENVPSSGENVPSSGENVPSRGENVPSRGENVPS